MSWLVHSNKIVSKGASYVGATKLSTMHLKRNQTQGQFFTPEVICERIWRLLANQKTLRPLEVLDNSCGSSRLLKHAPETAKLTGIDTDTRCINALIKDAKAVGRPVQAVNTYMQDCSLSNYDIAVCNPPFSVRIDSLNIAEFECARMGLYGDKTTTTTHEFAFEQVFKAAQVTAFIAPVTFQIPHYAEKHLVLKIPLPGNTFESEGAKVNTCLNVFGPQKFAKGANYYTGTDGEWPVLPNMLTEDPPPAKMFVYGENPEEDKITLPVTGHKTVILHKHKRTIRFSFECGLVQARVMNAVLQGKIDQPDRHRMPEGITYQGQRLLDLDVLLQAKDIPKALETLFGLIEEAGGAPKLSDTIEGYINKQIRVVKRAVTPMEHWVMRSSDAVVMTAKQMFMLVPGEKESLVKKGTTVKAIPVGGEYRFEGVGWTKTLSRKTVDCFFKYSDERAGAAEWEQIYPGLNAAYPELAKKFDQEMTNKGVDWLWPPQRKAVIEQLISPVGLIAGWEQGTGKMRSAIASAFMHAGRNLVVLQSSLIDECKEELGKIGLPRENYQFITGMQQVFDLKKINFISYEMLRKRGYAKRLRRRISFQACDEGGLLANMSSLQSQAIRQISARKTVIFDGTPIRSYPRDVLPQLQATSGSGSHQPYRSNNGMYLDEGMLEGALPKRGVDAFREHFIKFEWVTNSFKQDLQKGAKREIPVIKDVKKFRALLAPNVQRRLRSEPQFRDYCYSKDPILHSPLQIEWDEQHLEYYLDIASYYAEWYMQTKRDEGNKGLNLVSVLAKFNAVCLAANCPQHHIEGWQPYLGIPSKERYIQNLVRANIANGEKTIVFMGSPKTAERLTDEMGKNGIKVLPFHGEQNITKRNQLLNAEFKYGDTDVLASTWVGQRGLNIPQASQAILAQHTWTADVENQSIMRMARPSQKKDIHVNTLHYPGSIDVYQHQLVTWKAAAAQSALDYGDSAVEGDEFKHLDSIMVDFCEQTFEMTAQQLRGRRPFRLASKLVA